MEDEDSSTLAVVLAAVHAAPQLVHTPPRCVTMGRDTRSTYLLERRRL